METAPPSPISCPCTHLPDASGFLRAGGSSARPTACRAMPSGGATGRPGGGTGCRRVAPQSPAAPRCTSFPTRWSPPGSWTGTPTSPLWALNRRRVQLAGAEDARGSACGASAAADAGPGMGRSARAGTPTGGSRAPDRRRWMRCTGARLSRLAWTCTPRGSTALRWRRRGSPGHRRSVRRANRARRRRGAHRTAARARRRADDCRISPCPRRSGSTRRCVRPRREAHRLGVTGIHDVETRAPWRRSSACSRRARSGCASCFTRPSRAARARAAGRPQRGGLGMAPVGGVKMFLDGSLGSRTAWMLEPVRGLPRPRHADHRRSRRARVRCAMAAGAGIASTVHAIGDAAVRRALDLMGALAGSPSPIASSISSASIRPTSDRAATAGIVLSMQPAHLLTDIPLVERHWGSRGSGAYAFETSCARARAGLRERRAGGLDRSAGGCLRRARAPGRRRRSCRGMAARRKAGFEDAVRAYTAMPAAAAIRSGIHCMRASGNRRSTDHRARGARSEVGRCFCREASPSLANHLMKRGGGRPSVPGRRSRPLPQASVQSLAVG